MRARTVLAHAALLTGSLAIAALLGEAIVRARGVRPHPRVYAGERLDPVRRNFVADEQIGWRMRPNHAFHDTTAGRTTVYHSNAQGFRADRDFDTAETRPIIALIGDSFLFGIGVSAESTCAANLQRALPGAAVYNFALPGTGMDQIWLSLRHAAAAYRPRLVIAGFIDDDFERSQTAFREGQFTKPLYVLEADTLRRALLADRPNVVYRQLERRSALVQVWRSAVRVVGHARPVGQWWDLNAAIARAMAADARRLGATIVFVRMPRREAIRDFASLRGLMAELGTPYLDLADPTVHRPAGLHYATDSHINDAGHRFVADALLAWIRAHQPELARPSPPS